MAPQDLTQFARAVIDTYKAGVVTSHKKDNATNWDYDSAVFFAVSVITSIGKPAQHTCMLVLFIHVNNRN